MRFCTHCGKDLFDEAVICVGCGCAVGSVGKGSAQAGNGGVLLTKLSEKLKTNAVIWLVIGCLQILGGIFINWFLLIVGVLNIVSSVNDMNYSKTVSEDPSGIIARFEPLTGPVITLIYNLVIGGMIGVIGSIYYFVGIRSFVMENRQFFEGLG